MKVPYLNATDKPIYVGDTLIRAGETRDVNEMYIDQPDAQDDDNDAPALSRAEEIQQLSVKKATAELKALDDDELKSLESLEKEQEDPRSSLLDAIITEKLAREAAED